MSLLLFTLRALLGVFVAPALGVLAVVLLIAGLWPLAIVAGLFALLALVWPLLGLFVSVPAAFGPGRSPGQATG